MIRRFCLVALFGLLPLVAHAQTDPAALALEAAEQLEAAQRALAAAEGASDRVAALTQTVMAYENGLDALRESLRRANVRESSLRAVFDAESERVSQLLGVLLGIGSADGPLVLLHPAGPISAARSGMIVSEITPELHRQADELRARLEEAVMLRALQESAAQTMQEGLSGVQQARTELSQAISNRADLPARYLSDPEALQQLIDSSETLQAFATGLVDSGGETGSEGTAMDFSSARGRLPLPVSGTLLRRAGEADAAGIKRPGLLIATRPLALVTAPWPATIRYLGPLLDYGNVIIIEPDAGTLLVLAGLGEVYGVVGEVVPVGTPLGLMGGAEPDADMILQNVANGSGSSQTETLYIELRLGTEPVDPAEWFSETKE